MFKLVVLTVFCGSLPEPAFSLYIKKVRESFVTFSFIHSHFFHCPTHAWGSGAFLNQRTSVRALWGVNACRFNRLGQTDLSDFGVRPGLRPVLTTSVWPKSKQLVLWILSFWELLVLTYSVCVWFCPRWLLHWIIWLSFMVSVGNTKRQNHYAKGHWRSEKRWARVISFSVWKFHSTQLPVFQFLLLHSMVYIVKLWYGLFRKCLRKTVKKSTENN